MDQVAYEYARRAAKLSLVDIRKDELVAVADKAQSLDCPDVTIIGAGVSKVQDCNRFVDETVNHFGRRYSGKSSNGRECAAAIVKSACRGDSYFTYPSRSNEKVAGKVVLITEASSGIGEYGRRGARLALVAKLLGSPDVITIHTDGRDIGITIVTPGLIESEMSQGKVLSMEGKMFLPGKECVSTMSSGTLENEKPQVEEEQAQAEDNHTKQEDNSEMKDDDDRGEEERDQVEQEKDVEKEEEKEEEEEEKEEDRDEVKSKKSTKESGYATPGSERPTRERKTVERYTVSSPDKFPRSSSIKVLSIEKGNGTQLKDIPNVAFKLSKRKADDNLHALHSILFGKKAKVHHLKRNIGLFSGYVWTENEEKQRVKIKEKIDKCVKEKLVDFCNVLNIPINKTSKKKEELSAKLLQFLESPHATTDVLLADKEKKGKKRARKQTPSKYSGEGSKTSAKKQKQNSQVGKNQKQSSDIEDSDAAEPSDAKVDSQEDDDSSQKSESDNEESISEKEEDKEKAHKRTSKKILKEDQTTPVKKTTVVKTAKSNEKAPEKSSSKRAVTDSTSKSKQSASKKQKTMKENQNSIGKDANQKQADKSSKALVKDQGKGKSSEKAKAEPSKVEMHRVAVDILKEVDFNKATLSDILRQLGTHFDVDLMHRKAEVKDIITDVINNMSDDDGEEAENVGDDDEDDA
ncbi:11-beta-hydroxysteroid dehydrogenase-like 6 [Glycine soja]